MQTFELRVTNWAYGVQISGAHLSANGKLIQLPDFPKTIEVIGDSLSSGYTDTLEGLSSYAWGVGESLGNVEFSITAYPGICLVVSDFRWIATVETNLYYRTKTAGGIHAGKSTNGTRPPTPLLELKRYTATIPSPKLILLRAS
jgi:hypothetical protein